jgi:hypothetical protein
MPEPFDRVKRRLIRHVEALGPDEVRVLEQIARRLVLGQKRYGKLSLAHDGRVWRAEAAEEACDAAIYLSCLLTAPAKRGGQSRGARRKRP